MKKLLSVLLAVCMLLSIVPMAFAVEDADVNENVVDEVIDEVNEEELTDVPEEEAMPVFSLSEAFAYVTALDFDGLVAYIGQFLNLETLKYAIDNALEKLGGLNISDFLDGTILEGVFGTFTDVCATIADVFVDILAMVGIDFDQIVDYINNNEFLSFIASIYSYGSVVEPETTTEAEEVVVTEEPEETTTAEEEYEYVEVTPETGVADMGIAAFATLSLAGAAAYVLTKKKVA